MKKQTGQKEIMKKVLDYIRPQWLLVMLSLLMAVVSSTDRKCGRSYFRAWKGRIFRNF